MIVGAQLAEPDGQTPKEGRLEKDWPGIHALYGLRAGIDDEGCAILDGLVERLVVIRGTLGSIRGYGWVAETNGIAVPPCAQSSVYFSIRIMQGMLTSEDEVCCLLVCDVAGPVEHVPLGFVDLAKQLIILIIRVYAESGGLQRAQSRSDGWQVTQVLDTYLTPDEPIAVAESAERVRGDVEVAGNLRSIVILDRGIADTCEPNGREDLDAFDFGRIDRRVRSAFAGVVGIERHNEGNDGGSPLEVSSAVKVSPLLYSV